MQLDQPTNSGTATAKPASILDSIWSRRSVAMLFLACLVLSLIGGCDRLSRHKVLTIFFTGVPSLEEQDRMKETARVETPKSKPGTEALAASRKQALRERAIVARVFSHGPFASNACYSCHEVSASGGLRGFGKLEEAKGATAGAGIVPGKMVAPLNQLCVGCHDSKSPERADQEGLWIHGPVGNGYCIVCHGAHNGPEPYLLLKQADALCIDCHAEGLIANKAVHKDESACTTCHNPHLGKDYRLLKADYQESW